MPTHKPKITICIPHWQVRTYMTACLRSIRKHSVKYDLQVIVVDNGSRDDSLDYLRSLAWIELIERPEETHTNWPRNVFTAWDRGLHDARGEFYVTLHSDVFVNADDWLDPLLREISRRPTVAASGAWKLETEHPLYLWQKRVVGYLTAKVKTLLGRRRDVTWKQGHYPRDYCAMYRTELIRRHNLTFCPHVAEAASFRTDAGSVGHVEYRGGGHAIARQLMEAGYTMGMVRTREMSERIFHVAHGTAAVAAEKPLNHRRAQKKVERKVQDLFDEAWIQDLLRDDSLDGPPRVETPVAA